MRKAHKMPVFAALACAMLGSGCYTALKGPKTVSDFYQQPSYTGHDDRDSRDDLLVPTVGRFSDQDDPYRGFSGAPYGRAYGGYGTPIFGYDSRSGLFGNYGYGGGYYPGAGPVGYGYDPYYSGAYGTYVPPGYELVTTDELDHLRSSAILNITPIAIEPPDPAQLRQEEQEQARLQQDAWRQRQESRQRQVPVQRREPPATVEKKSTAAESTAAESTASTSEAKKSPRPKKRGR